MRREWQPEELIASWTLIDRDWDLLANKTGATRLGFALMVRFFDLEARFPAHAGELPPAAVDLLFGLGALGEGASTSTPSMRLISSRSGAPPAFVI